MEKYGVPYTYRKMEALSTIQSKLTGTNKTIIACTALVAGAAVEVFALIAGMNGVTLAGALGLFGSIAGFAFGRVSVKPRGTE